MGVSTLDQSQVRGCYAMWNNIARITLKIFNFLKIGILSSEQELLDFHHESLGLTK